MKGIFEGSSFAEFPPGTSPSLSNVRPFDPATGRKRMAQRMGLKKWVDFQFGGDFPIQFIQEIMLSRSEPVFQSAPALTKNSVAPSNPIQNLPDGFVNWDGPNAPIFSPFSPIRGKVESPGIRTADPNPSQAVMVSRPGYLAKKIVSVSFDITVPAGLSGADTNFAGHGNDCVTFVIGDATAGMSAEQFIDIASTGRPAGRNVVNATTFVLGINAKPHGSTVNSFETQGFYEGSSLNVANSPQPATNTITFGRTYHVTLQISQSAVLSANTFSYSIVDTVAETQVAAATMLLNTTFGTGWDATSRLTSVGLMLSSITTDLGVFDTKVSNVKFNIPRDQGVTN